MKKKLFSVLLALAMLTTLLPLQVWAVQDSSGLCEHHTEHSEDCIDKTGACVYQCKECQESFTGGSGAESKPQDVKPTENVDKETNGGQPVDNPGNSDVPDSLDDADSADSSERSVAKDMPSGDGQEDEPVLEYATEIVDLGEIETSAPSAAFFGLNSAGKAELTSENHVEWIDRIDIPDYAKQFYDFLVENSDGRGTDLLIDVDNAEQFNGNYVLVFNEVPADADKVQEVMNNTFEADSIYMRAVCDAFDRDHPEVFWLSGRTSATAGASWNGNTYVVSTYFLLTSDNFDIRADKYQNPENIREAMQQRDANVQKIRGGISQGDDYEKIVYFNQWLTKHNGYNSSSNLNNIDHDCRTCISGLKGTPRSEEGPVCEGYARAFKVLCDQENIPCVLVDGQAGGGAHMWNNVQLDNKWYAVDVTWNDPIINGNSDSDGNEDYLLVGANTVVDSNAFKDSHEVENSASIGGTNFTNGPELEVEKYDTGSRTKLENAVITVGSGSGTGGEIVYTGQPQTPAVKVVLSGKTLVPGTDYTVAYTGNTDAGTATVTVTAAEGSGYTGGKTMSFTIQPAEPVVEWPAYQQVTYTGAAAAIELPRVTLLTDEEYTGQILYSYMGDSDEISVEGMPSAVGNYLIMAEILPQDSNYKSVIYEADLDIISASVKEPRFFVGDAVATAGNAAEIAVGPQYGMAWQDIITVSPQLTAKVGDQAGSGAFALRVDGKALPAGEKPDAGQYAVEIVYNGTIGGQAYTNVPVCTVAVTVGPKEITPEIAVAADRIVYDGREQTPDITVTAEGTVLRPETDYTATYRNNVNAGTAEVVVEAAEGRNYTWKTASQEFTIRPAEYKGETTVERIVLTKKEQTLTVDLSALLSGLVNAEISTARIMQGEDFVSDATIAGKAVSFGIAAVETAGKTAEIRVNVTADNYRLFEVSIVLTTADKDDAQVNFTGSVPETKTYGDRTFEMRAEAKAAGQGEGTWTWESSNPDVLAVAGNGSRATVTVKGAGQAEIRVSYESDTTVGSALAGIAVAKKALTVKPADVSCYVNTSAPAFTLVYEGLVTGDEVKVSTKAAFTLTTKEGTAIAAEDAVKTAGTYTIAWSNYQPVATVLEGEAAGNYDWKAVTTGVLTVRTKSSGGGGGGSSSGGGGGGSAAAAPGTGTTTNSDGSTTTVTTDKATGAVTTTTKYTDGTTVKVVEATDGSSTTERIQPDGTKATTTQAKDGTATSEVMLSAKAVETAEKAESPVKLPIAQQQPQRESAKASTVTVSVPGSRRVKIEIPVKNAGGGIVAVAVAGNGEETVLKASVPTADGIVIEASGRVTVKIVDNSREFSDVPAGRWMTDAVDFVSARGLFSGTGEGRFSPDGSMTRGMLATVLHNLEGNPAATVEAAFSDLRDGAWYTASVHWAAEKGILSGYGDGRVGADNPITREQLAVMLWKYAGSPEASGSGLRFTDAASAGSYARPALQWATENGVMAGSSSGALNPRTRATRAEVAQMLKNFLSIR